MPTTKTSPVLQLLDTSADGGGCGCGGCGCGSSTETRSSTGTTTESTATAASKGNHTAREKNALGSPSSPSAAVRRV